MVSQSEMACQIDSLRSLVCSLLRTNQKLRDALQEAQSAQLPELHATETQEKRDLPDPLCLSSFD